MTPRWKRGGQVCICGHVHLGKFGCFHSTKRKELCVCQVGSIPVPLSVPCEPGRRE